MKLIKIYESLLTEVKQDELVKDYFKKRIPFLKNNWHELDYDRGVQIFADQGNHSDAKTVDGDGNIITYKQFKTGVSFEYTRGKVSGNDNVSHNFKLKPFIMAEPNTNDELLNTVLKRAMLMQLENIGVHESIELPIGVEIPDVDLDRIVNEMNKTFFVFEEYLHNFGI